LASGEAIPFRSEFFDICVCFETLEHVRSDYDVLREINRVLKRGGGLFLSLPNRFFPVEQHSVIFGKKVIEKSLPFFPWLPTFLRRKFARANDYTSKTIVMLLHKSGFAVPRIDFLFPAFKNIKSKVMRAFLMKIQYRFKYAKLLLGNTIFVFAKKR
jgi:SAM-dependent methyltransferase